MHFFTKRAVVLGIVATLGFAGTAQAQAVQDGTSAQLTGGDLTMTTAPLFSDFTPTALTGAAQGKSTEIADWAVNDARGTGAGYLVTMAASPLLDSATEMVGATLTVTAPTATKDAANASVAPAVAGGSISAGASPAIVSAAANQGLGAWTYARDADDLTIAIPANAPGRWEARRRSARAHCCGAASSRTRRSRSVPASPCTAGRSRSTAPSRSTTTPSAFRTAPATDGHARAGVRRLPRDDAQRLGADKHTTISDWSVNDQRASATGWESTMSARRS